MAIFIPVLVAFAVAIAITVTVVVTKDPPYSCYEKEISGRLHLMVTDFKYEIMPHKYYDCDNTRTIDPQPSSCYRTLTIQFDERDEAIIPIDMFAINTERANIPFQRLISDGFKFVSMSLINYDWREYTRSGWMEQPIYLDFYRDTARLEGDNNPDEMSNNGKNPQITTGNITITLRDVTTREVVVPC